MKELAHLKAKSTAMKRSEIDSLKDVHRFIASIFFSCSLFLVDFQRSNDCHSRAIVDVFGQSVAELEGEERRLRGVVKAAEASLGRENPHALNEAPCHNHNHTRK